MSIIDQGEGINMNKGVSVFSPFIQYKNNQIRTRIGGAGLGLAISKELIELHQERIWFENSPEESLGVIFNFTLSLARYNP